MRFLRRGLRQEDRKIGRRAEMRIAIKTYPRGGPKSRENLDHQSKGTK